LPFAPGGKRLLQPILTHRIAFHLDPSEETVMLKQPMLEKLAAMRLLEMADR